MFSCLFAGEKGLFWGFYAFNYYLCKFKKRKLLTDRHILADRKYTAVPLSGTAVSALFFFGFFRRFCGGGLFRRFCRRFCRRFGYGLFRRFCRLLCGGGFCCRLSRGFCGLCRLLCGRRGGLCRLGRGFYGLYGLRGFCRGLVFAHKLINKLFSRLDFVCSLYYYHSMDRQKSKYAPLRAVLTRRKVYVRTMHFTGEPLRYRLQLYPLPH